jgi:predicted metal-dependent hydrolase
VRVAVPGGYPFDAAKIYVHKKREWIQKQQRKMMQLHQKREEIIHWTLPFDKNVVRKKLTDRLNDLAERYGFNYNNISIRNQKTRWGSCSHRNNISLNVNLFLLPEKLIDYVILHELLHTCIKNHSQEFWDCFDQYVGNAKALSKELKEYGMVLL